MIVFVDIEHPDGHGRSYGEAMLAARTRITYRLEDVSGRHCHLVRYDRVDRGLLDHLGATAVFVSGNSVDPEHYPADALDRFLDLLREIDLPLFGFCGGFQWLALALGADVVPLDAARLPDPDDPRLVTLDDGRPFEHGYHPVTHTPGSEAHPLLRGLGDAPVYRHAHGLHVPTPPSGFVNLASTDATPVQLVAHEYRPVVGSQFHPEYWTDEHPAGRSLIENFLDWAGVSRRSAPAGPA